MTEEDLLRKAVCKAASYAGMTAEEAAMMASRTVQIHEISKDAKSLLKKIVGIAIQGIDLTDMRGINLAGSLIFSGLLPIIWQSLLRGARGGDSHRDTKKRRADADRCQDIRSDICVSAD